jgi:cysteine desulfurase
MAAYFDHNATTPLLPEARAAWLRAMDGFWQNPSSLYREAGLASQALEAARERLADLLGVEEPERVVFTSGASEANNTLFAGLARCLPPDGCIAISAIEHPSVRAAALAWLGRARVMEIPVDATGRVQPEVVKKVISEHQPALISVMTASNESGVLQPWQELAALCRTQGVRFHTDAAQWLGKMPATGLANCDYVTGSGHKFGGPKGVGFLLLAHAQESFPLIHGGPQEQGRRAGTEDFAGIEAMVTALEVRAGQLQQSAQAQTPLRDAFISTMQAAFPGLRVISGDAPRLWNTVLMVMPAHSNLKWLTRLSRLGFAISTGSACSSGREGSSVIVRALGTDEEELRRVVRISAGHETTAADWQALAAAFAEVGRGLENEARAASWQA